MLRTSHLLQAMQAQLSIAKIVQLLKQEPAIDKDKVKALQKSLVAACSEMKSVVTLANATVNTFEAAKNLLEEWFEDLVQGDLAPWGAN